MEWMTGVQFLPEATKGFLIFATISRLAMKPTQPPFQWIPGASAPERKQPGCEVDHLPPSSDEVKNLCSYTPTSPYVFIHSMGFS